jgi:Cu(I)/Ag(I) efflux system membrane fusion protein
MTSGGQGVAELITRQDMGRPQLQRDHRAPLVIPDSAPLITGKRAVVYVAVPGMPGTFEGREVGLGPRAKGYYIVRKGLKKGDLVVVNGNFKIDSAVQILAKPSMMEPGKGKGNEKEMNMESHQGKGAHASGHRQGALRSGKMKMKRGGR